MSPRLRREPFAADHERARDLAALRLDGPLPESESAWLADHLEWCRPCTAVAAEYDEQRLALRALRHDQPQPPRDLWARTAAAIEAEPARRRPDRRGSGILGLTPLVGALVVAVAIGAGLLNSSALFPPLGSTTKGDDVVATPIALSAGELQVLSRGENGSLEMLSQDLEQVCPVAADSCGLKPDLAVTPMGSLSPSADVNAVISPDRGQMVVFELGDGARGVYVVPVQKPGAATATESVTPVPAVGSPVVASAHPTAGIAASPGAEATPEPPQPTGTPATSSEPASSPEAVASAGPSGEPESTPVATDASSPGPSVAPDESVGPSEEPTGEPDATDKPRKTAPPTEAPTEPAVTPTPTVEVTPGPDGTIEIARDVVVVGSVASYSPDGTRFVFTARPAEGSTGPDVFVWRVGDRHAVAVTTDHRSVFSGWLGDRALVSRVVDGTPRTFVVDLATGDQRLAEDAAMWRPTVGPGRRMAAWWDGAVRRSGDGTQWLPERGRLVLGAWKDAAAEVQVLADGAIADWDVRWADDATVLAVWVAGEGHTTGRLSLYAVDPVTGRADLDHPMVSDAPAFAGYSLRPGRLAWSAPEQGGDTSVQVLAWSGDTVVGKLSLPTESGATVVR